MSARKKTDRNPSSPRPRNRRLEQKRSTELHFETLEAKHLLAAITVSNNSDVISLTADTTSISALISNDGGDGISLREAIAAANSTVGEDTITFDASVFSGGSNSLTRLTQGQLEINDSLTIDASSVGGVVITGDADGDDITVPGTYITDVSASFGEYTNAGETDDLLDDNSRVINFSNSSEDLTLTNLTITGGRQTGEDEDGGGIRSIGDLSLISSNVSGNSTTGSRGHGGGVSSNSSDVTLTNSTISGNSATGYASRGGGISTSRGTLNLLASTVSGNYAEGNGGGTYVTGELSLNSTSVNGNRSGNRSGGGVFASGIVSLTHSTVSENRSNLNGGGLVGNGAVTLIDSSISRNIGFGEGGGVYASGTVSLTRSSVNENTSFVSGGGVFALGTVSLTDSSISGNVSSSDGGGIFASGTTLITNSTMSGNRASRQGYTSGGGIEFRGNLSLVNSTVTNNSAETNGDYTGGGGGIDGPSSGESFLTLRNSIVSGNSATSEAPDVRLSTDGLSNVNVEHSLIGDTELSGISATTGVGNILDQAALLGPLADNGGSTLTHALLPGSPAIDAGINSLAVDENGDSLIADQRENVRIGAGTVDIGAVEFDIQAPVFPSVLGDANLDTEVDFADISPFINLLSASSFQDEADINRDGVVDFSDIGPFIDLLSGGSPTGPTGSLVVTTNFDIEDPNDGLNSLREAIAFANDPNAGIGGDGDGLANDTITFDANVFSGGQNNVIRLTQGELSISDDLSIDGAPVGGVLITGDAAGDDATLAGSDITDISASFGGTAGATDDLLDDNSRVLRVLPGLADLTLSGLTITGGRTFGSADGGGIEFNSHGVLTLFNSEVSGNRSDDEGGGVFSMGDVLSTNSFVRDNVSRRDGGGISLNDSHDGDAYGGLLDLMINFDSSVVSGNVSGEDGGGVSASADVTFNDSTVSGNSSADDAGGVFTYDNLVFNNSYVSDNHSGGRGGGVFAWDASFNSSTVSKNSSVRDGGGVLTYGDVTFDNSTVSGNISDSSGGGVSASNASFNHSTVSGNSSGGVGGGIHARFGDLSLINSTVSGNSSVEDGGGIWFYNSTILLVNSTVANNSAGGTGGGIFGEGPEHRYHVEVLTLHNSIVSGNTDNGTAPDVDAVADLFNDLTVEHSLIGDTTGSGITATTGLGNILDQPALLGSLTDNGGATLTHALLSGSPGIDAGSNAIAVDENGNPLTTDQRGELRIESGTVDIGAFEFGVTTLFVLGDANLDAVVDFSDIAPFIELLSNNTFLDEADIDRSGIVDFADIGPFIDLLAIGGSNPNSTISIEESFVTAAELFDTHPESIDEVLNFQIDDAPEQAS